VQKEPVFPARNAKKRGDFEISRPWHTLYHDAIAYDLRHSTLTNSSDGDSSLAWMEISILEPRNKNFLMDLPNTPCRNNTGNFEGLKPKLSISPKDQDDLVPFTVWRR
jgi:hypothetical protein